MVSSRFSTALRKTFSGQRRFGNQRFCLICHVKVAYRAVGAPVRFKTDMSRNLRNGLNRLIVNFPAWLNYEQPKADTTHNQHGERYEKCFHDLCSKLYSVGFQRSTELSAAKKPSFPVLTFPDCLRPRTKSPALIICLARAVHFETTGGESLFHAIGWDCAHTAASDAAEIQVGFEGLPTDGSGCLI
jgi:hypothetical protein